MKELLKYSAAVTVIAVSGLALGACIHSSDGDEMTRLTLNEAMADPAIVGGTLSGDPYATEQLLGDNGPDSVTKNDQSDDSHTLVIDGGTVTEDPADSDAANDFMMGAAPVSIAGFTGSRHDRILPDLDEVHTVVVYTDKSGSSDTDYVDFGFWFLGYAADDHVGHFTHTFARGSMPSGDVSAVTGSATYSGAATGLYVIKDGGTPTGSGQFTATAALMADFDAATISGTVSDFMDAAGDAINPMWVVSLDSAALDQATGRIDESNGRAGTTGGGNWRAEFHGDASAGAPGTVAGTFDAHLSNGHVGGAFAAHSQ